MRKTLILAFTFLISLPLWSAVRGTVMNIDGAPLTGARVEAYLQETGEARAERIQSENPKRAAIATATTDASGNFSLDVKKQPVVVLVVEAAGYEPGTVTLTADDDAGAIALRSAAAVTGTITAAGKPVAGARVVVRRADGEVIATTDAEGRYTVPDPSVWAFNIAVRHPDFVRVLDAGSGRKFTLNYKLEPGITVAGKVVGDDGQTPVAGAKVLAGGRRTTTTDDGTFTLAHLPEKRPEIVVIAGDRVVVNTKQDRSVTIKMARGATITGVARDAKTQQPLAGVAITLGPPENEVLAFTDGNGAYTARNLPPGRRMFVASHPNYSFARVEVDARAGQNVVKNFLGTQNATIIGTVIDEARKVVPATRLLFSPVEESMGMPFRFEAFAMQRATYSAPDGRFVLRGVPPDQSIEISARKRGLPSASAGPLKLVSGEVKRGVTLVLPRGIIFTGKVMDSSGRPLAGVAVVPNDAEESGPGGAIRRVVQRTPGPDREPDLETGNDGTFTTQLKEGRYDLVFRKSGYAPRVLRAVQVRPDVEPLEVTLERGVEVTGRVIRRDGSGVPDVDIMSIDRGSTGQIRTGPDGSFTIPDLAPGPMMIMVMKADDFIREMRNVTVPASDVVIEIPPGGRIEGRVVEKGTKRPVTQFRAGVSNTAGGRGFRFAGPPMNKNFTSEDGSFVLENVPPGKVDLMVDAAGFVTGRLPALAVEEGKVLRDVEVELESGVRLTGKVTGPDGAPLPGVIVREEQPEQQPMMMGRFERGSTDGAGEYAIEALEPGEKTFVFQREGYLTERKSVKLTGKESRLDVRLSRGKDIAGVVVDEQGVPIANANITAGTGVQDAGFRSTRSDSNGAFRFEGLAPGRYTFRANKIGFVTGEVKDIDLDAAAAGLRITLTGGGTVFGRVTGIAESELASAVVWATGTSGRRSTASVDPNGNYRIEGVPTGTVRVSAEAGGFPMRRNTTPQVVEVAPGSELQVDLEFKSDLVIRGRVTKQGRSLDGAMVMFVPREAKVQTRGSTRTDSGGNYELSGLEPGGYTVGVFDMNRSTSFDTTYDITGSATFDIEIRGSEIRGRVVDADSGQPIAEAVVTLDRADGDARFFGGLSLATDPSGAVVFDTVSPGTYRARAQKEHYGPAIAEVVVGDSDSRTVELKLGRTDGARLRVVDGRDGRALGAFVWIRDQQGRTAWEGQPRPNSDGVLVVPLAAGAYKATISSMGYAARTVSLVVPSQEIRVALSPGGALVIQSDQSSRQVAKLMTPTGDFFQRGPFARAELALDPGTTVLENLAPGPYVLQLLDDRGNVKGSYSVTVVEGQTVQLEI